MRILNNTRAHKTLRYLRDGMLANDAQLNDPRGDGTGDDSMSPTGDDYNVLFDLVLDALCEAGISDKRGE